MDELREQHSGEFEQAEWQARTDEYGAGAWAARDTDFEMFDERFDPEAMTRCFYCKRTHTHFMEPCDEK